MSLHILLPQQLRCWVSTSFGTLPIPGELYNHIIQISFSSLSLLSLFSGSAMHFACFCNPVLSCILCQENFFGTPPIHLVLSLCEWRRRVNFKKSAQHRFRHQGESLFVALELPQDLFSMKTWNITVKMNWKWCCSGFRNSKFLTAAQHRFRHQGVSLFVALDLPQDLFSMKTWKFTTCHCPPPLSVGFL